MARQKAKSPSLRRRRVSANQAGGLRGQTSGEFSPVRGRDTSSLALTQVIRCRAKVVASCNLLPVRMLAGATYDEAAPHDNTAGID